MMGELRVQKKRILLRWRLIREDHFVLQYDTSVLVTS
jgi:hypothetical protein